MFYRRLGFEPVDRVAEGERDWAFLRAGSALLMLARATAPIEPEEQAVLFYLYTRNVAALREQLRGDGIEVSKVGHPPHMPAGEIRVADPDGYCLLVGQRSDGRELRELLG